MDQTNVVSVFKYSRIYYSAIKRNEVLIPVPAWINLGNSLSRKKSLTEDQCCMVTIT